MFEKVVNCPVCSSTNFKNHIICKDHMITQESFSIVKCIDCNFLFTNPRPDTEHIGNYYKSDQYISHTDKSNNLINSVYKLARIYTLNKKVKLISSLANDKNILDFGCGTGDFLNACKSNSWKIHGFEPDKDASIIASKKTGIEILNTISQLDDLKNISIITLWHVLEHISDLNNTIQKLLGTLSENGKILIAVPNHESLDAMKYKEHWAAYDVPRHLYHFSQESMTLLMEKHSLKIKQILPMKLDSYYVSLLSEKYISGHSNIMNSIINGWKSNIYAKNNNKNYSSLIYICSK